MMDVSLTNPAILPVFVPPPPPPPATEAPGLAPTAPTDSLSVGQNAGVVAAATGLDFGALPFDAGATGPVPLDLGPTLTDMPAGPLREAALATAGAIVEASAEANAAFIDHLRGTFTEAGIAALESLSGAGQLDALDATGGANLRESIKAFLAGGGDVALAEAVVRGVADPGAISQICANTCAASTAQAGWAASAPAEYFRAAVDLATKGTATITRAGIAIRLEVDEPTYSAAGTQNFQAIADAGMEGIDRVDASVQAALMNLGSGGAYDIRQDKLLTSTSVGEYGNIELNLTGLSFDDSQGLFLALLSSPFSTGFSFTYGEGGATWQRDSVAELDTMKTALATGTKFAYTLVSVGTPVGGDNAEVAPDASAHVVAVIGFQDGNIEYYDPQGRIQTVTEAEFLSKMSAVDPASVMLSGIGGSSSFGTGASYVQRFPRNAAAPRR